MAVEEVYMDIPAVREFAKTFDTISDVLNGVAKALEMISNVLKATAFFGGPGNMIAARFIDMIRPYIEQISEKCAELCKDVGASVDAYERGDAVGAARFH